MDSLTDETTVLSQHGKDGPSSPSVLCTDVYNRTVDYYTQRSSHVFSCFIDFNKAFDSMDY